MWEALTSSGASVGYGARFVLVSARPPREVVVAYTEPGSPARNAGIARGTRILKIDGVDVISGSDVDTLNAGLYPSAEGETHEFEVQDLNASDPRTVTMTAREVAADPVQHVTVLDTDSGPVGYLLFNDFIATAERELFDAFAELERRGIADLVLDLRYNGGGYLDIASQVGFMVAGPAAAQGRVFEELQFNDKHRDFDPVTGNRLEPLLFHTTTVGFTMASGQELPSREPAQGVHPHRAGDLFRERGGYQRFARHRRRSGADRFHHLRQAIRVLPTDNCGTTYFTVQFRGINAKGFGDFADGFSPANVAGVQGTPVPGCSVADDFGHGFADPEERRLQAALRYRADGACPAPTGTGAPPGGTGIERKSLALRDPRAGATGLKVLRADYRR